MEQNTPTSQSSAPNSKVIFAVSIQIGPECVNDSIVIHNAYHRAIREHYLILCEPSVYWWCRRVFVPGYDYMDLYQDVMLKLWKVIDHYDPSKGSIYTWAKPVIVNHLYRLLRDQKRPKRWMGEYPEPLPDNLASDDINPLKLMIIKEEAEENHINWKDFI